MTIERASPREAEQLLSWDVVQVAYMLLTLQMEWIVREPLGFFRTQHWMMLRLVITK